MVEIVTGRQGSITLLLEQGDTLVAAVQKRLGIVFSVDGQAQKLRVELLGARHILHMQNNVIEAVDLDHLSFPPMLPTYVALTPLRAGQRPAPHHTPSQDHQQSSVLQAGARSNDRARASKSAIGTSEHNESSM